MTEKPDIAEEGLIALAKIAESLPLTTDYERGVADGLTLAKQAKPKSEKIGCTCRTHKTHDLGFPCPLHHPECPHTKEPCEEFCTREPGGCMYGVAFP